MNCFLKLCLKTMKSKSLWTNKLLIKQKNQPQILRIWRNLAICLLMLWLTVMRNTSPWRKNRLRWPNKVLLLPAISQSKWVNPETREKTHWRERIYETFRNGFVGSIMRQSKTGSWIISPNQLPKWENSKSWDLNRGREVRQRSNDRRYEKIWWDFVRFIVR